MAFVSLTESNLQDFQSRVSLNLCGIRMKRIINQKQIVMKKLLTTIVFLGILSATSVAQESIILRIIEAHANGVSKMILTDENGESSIIELKPMLFDAPFQEALISNQETIQATMNKILSKGFSLENMSTDSKDVLYTLMVFTKED